MSPPRGPGRSGRRAGAVLVLVLVGLLLAPMALAYTQDAHATTSPASIEGAAAVLTDQLDASRIPGGAVVVVHDGTIEARGVGDSGHGNVTGDTPFVIGSASKSFTALAVMQLVDAGRVDLDAPVREYVPEFEPAEGQSGDDIPVRDVLHQTSGLDDLAGGPLLASAADGTPAEAIDQAREFQNKASFFLDYVYSENSNGFHAPAYIQRILADSLDASRKGQLVLQGVDPASLEASDISQANRKAAEERES